MTPYSTSRGIMYSAPPTEDASEESPTTPDTSTEPATAADEPATADD